MALLAATGGSPTSHAAEPAATRAQAFTSDPGWVGHNNRPVASRCRRTVQDFGLSPHTSATGGAPGEIGGRFDRSLEPASYAKTIAPTSLLEPLSASGTIALRASSAESGVLFGWFNSRARGWRTPNSVVFRLDGQEGHSRLQVEYATRSSLAAGRPVVVGSRPFRLRPGRRHHWSMHYDPKGAGGAGEVTFAIRGAAPVRLPLADGDKRDGATFDRFGFLDQQIPGASLSAYVDDVRLGGARQTFGTGGARGWHGRATAVASATAVGRTTTTSASIPQTGAGWAA